MIPSNKTSDSLMNSTSCNHSCGVIHIPFLKPNRLTLGVQTAVCTGYLWWWNLASTENRKANPTCSLNLSCMYVYVFVIVCQYMSSFCTCFTGWWFEPLWKIWTSIGMIRNPIYGKIKLMATKPATSLHMLYTAIMSFQKFLHLPQGTISWDNIFLYVHPRVPYHW